jgi:hypothetical protein
MTTMHGLKGVDRRHVQFAVLATTLILAALVLPVVGWWFVPLTAALAGLPFALGYVSSGTGIPGIIRVARFMALCAVGEAMVLIVLGRHGLAQVVMRLFDSPAETWWWALWRPLTVLLGLMLVATAARWPRPTAAGFAAVALAPVVVYAPPILWLSAWFGVIALVFGAAFAVAAWQPRMAFWIAVAMLTLPHVFVVWGMHPAQAPARLERAWVEATSLTLMLLTPAHLPGMAGAAGLLAGATLRRSPQRR